MTDTGGKAGKVATTLAGNPQGRERDGVGSARQVSVRRDLRRNEADYSSIT